MPSQPHVPLCPAAEPGKDDSCIVIPAALAEERLPPGWRAATGAASCLLAAVPLFGETVMPGGRPLRRTSAGSRSDPVEAPGEPTCRPIAELVFQRSRKVAC